MILFRCETFYHLINAINLKMTLLSDKDADLVLTHSCDFSEVIPKLKNEGLFSEIYYSEETWKDSVKLNENASRKRREMTKSPSSFLYQEEWLENQYDEFYVPTFTSSYCYLVYYSFYRRFNSVPRIFLYEDGTDTYSRNGIDTIRRMEGICIKRGDIPNSMWVEKNYGGVYVYEPSVCQHGNQHETYAIPKMSPEVYSVLKRVFGYEELPQERFIYFSEPFRDEFINNNEMELLDRIAEKVGKDNIIVKLHPRTTFEQFTEKGYKLMKNMTVPWEIIAADKNVENKVLMAVSSTTILSPMFMHDYDTKAIMLTHLVTKNRFFSTTEDFARLRDCIYKHFNRDSRKLFIPKTYDEMDLACDYFNMLMEINNG